MAKQQKFQTVDVFTDHVFGGNPLAIFTDASGISDDADMQKIAAEMNYSKQLLFCRPMIRAMPQRCGFSRRRMKCPSPDIQMLERAIFSLHSQTLYRDQQMAIC